jgi:DNA-binding NtrC family response regulator
MLSAVWLQAVSDALRPLGELHIAPEGEAAKRIEDYSLIVVDTPGMHGDVAGLVGELHKARPGVPIVVVTTSPTWQRARQIFDYIRKTLDQEHFLAICREILERLPSHTQPHVNSGEDNHAAQTNDLAGRQ